jgi:hypothetical protein
MSSISGSRLLGPLSARHRTVHGGMTSVACCHRGVHSRILSCRVVLSGSHVLPVGGHRVHHLRVGVGLSVDGVVLCLLDRRAEVLLEVKLGPDRNVLETWILERSCELVVLDVVYLVVRHHVVRNAINGDAHGLLDQTIGAETVAVHQRTDQRALELLVLLGAWQSRFDLRVGRWLGWSERPWHLNILLAVGIGALEAVDTRKAAAFALDGSLLFAGRERLVELAVNQEVAQDAAGTPGNTISPALDTACIFFVDEDVAALDELATLAVVRSSWNVVKLATQASLEEDEAIHAVLDEASEGGHQRPCSACAHVEGCESLKEGKRSLE